MASWTCCSADRVNSASDVKGLKFGVSAPGGFDCSGFVWRVYKIQEYADEGTLADTLQGRTTFAMSGEVPAAKRGRGDDGDSEDCRERRGVGLTFLLEQGQRVRDRLARLQLPVDLDADHGN